MPRFSISSIILCIFMLALGACSKDKKLDHTAVSQVTVIFAPDDSRYIKLQPATNATVLFEWEQARAEDGGLVMYEIAFDKEGGDFSKPVYKLPADNGGIFNKATVSHKLLNTIGNLAGIPSLSTGKLKWTVYSSKGINEVKSSQARSIEIERPAGFASIPTDVFLTGTATEAGADLANAIRLKQTTSGVFEVYTSLKAGSYQLTDRNSGTPNTYSVTGTALKEGGSTDVAGATKVYRIVFDFNNTSATFTEVKGMGLWFAPNNTIQFNLNYAGNGQWKAENQNIEFKQEGWGRDERYKFRMQVNDGSADSFEWYGSVNNDNQRPTAGTAPAYFYLQPIVSNDQWNYCFKFQTEADMKPCDIIIDFSTTQPYTHKVVIK